MKYMMGKKKRSVSEEQQNIGKTQGQKEKALWTSHYLTL